MPKVSRVYQQATYLGDSVFAASDGIITTFAVVSGVSGASLAPSVVLILGFANLLADGLSMAFGNYMNIKSQMEYEKALGKKVIVNSPLKHGAVTYISFVVAGFLPMIPYVFNFHNKFLGSIIVVVISLFFIGALRSLFTHKNFIKGGFELLLLGGMAASFAYLTGYFIEYYVL
ncbi:MAG: VIT1/CCC1 transporter family protein [Patescibacteria group bacterium]|nr:VIT1/CCC1 transporter family protein [Patescibacteria group bacterium]MCX7928459.1 VIT1/CCC1 transporter family protein [Patescibacteria group bacterium]